MSQDELTRLVNDVMSNPAMVSEASDVKDQASMAEFISSKGYILTTEEIDQVWTMAVNYLGVKE